MTYSERDVWEFMSSYGISRDSAIELLTEQEEVMSAGREHAERRAAQAAAARKHRNRAKFHKATRKAWKKEENK